MAHYIDGLRKGGLYHLKCDPPNAMGLYAVYQDDVYFRHDAVPLAEGDGGLVYDVRDLAVGDLNRDGRLDVVAMHDGLPSRIYMNQGRRRYVGHDLSAESNASRVVALGDLDLDGDLDLVAGNYGQRNRVYLNNADGTFAPGTDVAPDQSKTTSLVLGDLDRNGVLDLVAGNDGQNNLVYLGAGDGTFLSLGNLPPVLNTEALVLADLDRDGILDLVVGNRGEHNALFYGAGNGTFLPPVFYTASP